VRPRIYVQIPAYRDRELWPTLRDLYRTAARPCELRVGVVWQHGPDERPPPDIDGLPHLELIPVPAAESLGCNWARAVLGGRWDGEPYTLLLDSHHRFVAGWDSRVVEMYERLRTADVPRPLITAYLPSYRPGDGADTWDTQPLKIYANGREGGVLTKLVGYPIPGWRQLEGPVAADYVSLHFLFAAGRFNLDVPADPEVYFFGDEVAVGLRAFTCGYELVHPHVVLGWHAYDRASRVPHWDDHVDWWATHDTSLARLRRLFGGLAPEVELLGRAQSIADYETRIMTPLVEPA
jgi:hypothetical protein